MPSWSMKEEAKGRRDAGTQYDVESWNAGLDVDSDCRCMSCRDSTF